MLLVDGEDLESQPHDRPSCGIETAAGCTRGGHRLQRLLGQAADRRQVGARVPDAGALAVLLPLVRLELDDV